MPLALASLMALRPEPVRRFLRVAVEADVPTRETLQTQGLPLYEIDDLLRRLTGAGEVRDGGWVAEARAGYRTLITPALALADLPASERPREKALRSGIAALADAELLAVLLRTGVEGEHVLAFAARLLADHDGLVGLAGLDVNELIAAHGLGEAKASELAAAFELGKRLRQAARRQRPILNSPELVIEAIGADLVALRHEEFWCLPLDAGTRLIGEPRRVTRGDVDGTDAGPRAFFRCALQAGAVACIAVHNHPSGEPRPSEADRAVTRRLVAAGRTIDLALSDHVIIGDAGRYTSLRRSEPELFR